MGSIIYKKGAWFFGGEDTNNSLNLFSLNYLRTWGVKIRLWEYDFHSVSKHKHKFLIYSSILLPLVFEKPHLHVASFLLLFAYI